MSVSTMSDIRSRTPSRGVVSPAWAIPRVDRVGGSPMSEKEDYGGGRLKTFLSGGAAALAGFAMVISHVSALHDSIFKLSDSGHVLLATIVFSFFVVYATHDMIRFRDETKVFLAGLAVIAIAAYWWL